jgi:hypothetical protein
MTSINVTTTEPLPDVVLVNGVEYRREQVSGRGDLRPILDWQLDNDAGEPKPTHEDAP